MAKKAKNPYAVCRAQSNKSGRKWSRKKFEACVLKVKRKSRR